VAATARNASTHAMLSATTTQSAPRRGLVSALLILAVLALTVALTAPPQAQAPHRLAIRTVGGTTEIFDRTTGSTFTPRGANYIRLDRQEDGTLYHSLLDPQYYDRARVFEALTQMSLMGFNTVRIFLNHYALADSPGRLSATYLDNLVDFLAIAKSRNIYVMLTIDWLPEKYFRDGFGGTRLVDGSNQELLLASGVRSSVTFYRDLIRALQVHGAAFDAILAFELKNEFAFDVAAPPFSLSRGTLTAPSGRSYNLAVAADKERLKDDGLSFWIDQVRNGIRELDPTALVAIGFAIALPGQPGYKPGGYAAMADPETGGSTVDIVDFHPYPGLVPGGFDALADSLFVYERIGRKPLLMGEYGSPRDFSPNAGAAAEMLRAWQVESCTLGYSGWLLWTWDLKDAEFYNATEADRVIARTASPVETPDPCRRTETAP
jgi:hypothetical protein